MIHSLLHNPILSILQETCPRFIRIPIQDRALSPERVPANYFSALQQSLNMAWAVSLQNKCQKEEMILMARS